MHEDKKASLVFVLNYYLLFLKKDFLKLCFRERERRKESEGGREIDSCMYCYLLALFSLLFQKEPICMIDCLWGCEAHYLSRQLVFSC